MPASEGASNAGLRQDAGFHTTHWSAVLSARDKDSSQARQALAELCQAYWYPLNAYVRRSGHSPEDAQDLTQRSEPFFHSCGTDRQTRGQRDSVKRCIGGLVQRGRVCERRGTWPVPRIEPANNASRPALLLHRQLANAGGQALNIQP